MQSMFSAAVFVIDHPERADDEAGKQLAGVEGMLRAYDSILREKPRKRIVFLDELLAMREAGTLAAWVRQQSAKCKQADRPNGG